jgi:hypothetical protein
MNILEKNTVLWKKGVEIWAFDGTFCSISGWWRLARMGGRVEDREEEEEKREEDGTEILDCVLTNSLVFGIK